MSECWREKSGRMMSMSDSWFEIGARETERKNPPLGRVGCKRRLTRHDWNGGNNYLAEEVLGYVHGLKTIPRGPLASRGVLQQSRFNTVL
jgi:hypothetical protein